MHPAASALTDMVIRSEVPLAAAFSGQALDKERATVRSAAVKLASPGLQSLDGGADTFVLAAPAFPDEHTTVYSGSYRAWSRVAQIQGTKTVQATPSNILDFTATLKDAGGTWKVDQFTWTFHPGSEP